MTFDAHVHVGEFPLFGVDLDKDGLVDLLRECGLAGAVIFHPDNEYCRQVVDAVPSAFGLYWANPKIPGFVEEAARFLEHPKFVGVKLHPLLDGFHPNDPSLAPVMEILESRQLPVLVHTGHPIFTLPWSVEELALNWPRVPVVFAHMGHGNIVYINASIDIAERRPNVYLETSGMPMHAKVREAVERIGSARVLYGSDAPFGHPDVEIRKIEVAGLSPEDLRSVLGRSARALYFGAADAEGPTTGPVGDAVAG